MSKKKKLLDKVKQRPKNLTWDEVTTLMVGCGFKLVNARGGGSRRMFVHAESRQKVSLHEPHPQKTLLPYMVDQLIAALEQAGELE